MMLMLVVAGWEAYSDQAQAAYTIQQIMHLVAAQ